MKSKLIRFLIAVAVYAHILVAGYGIFGRSWIFLVVFVAAGLGGLFYTALRPKCS